MHLTSTFLLLGRACPGDLLSVTLEMRWCGEKQVHNHEKDKDLISDCVVGASNSKTPIPAVSIEDITWI